MSAAWQTHDEGRRFLLGVWEGSRGAIVARTSRESGFPLDACEQVLDRVFLHIRTGEADPLRRAVRELFRAKRERTRRHAPEGNPGDGAAVGFHDALMRALRPELDVLPTPVAVDALVLLSQVSQTAAGFYVELTQFAARHTSERKAAELERALARLSAAQETLLHEARLKAMGALADGVAHDVNNALNAVLLRTTLMSRHVDGSARAHLDSIEAIVRHAAGTVQRLQEFARRRDRPSRAACDPAVVAGEAIELTRPHWSDRARLQSRTIDVRLEAAPVPPVQADPSELRAILVDLLLNATEAIAADGSIVVTLRAEGDRVFVEVADTGPGIPPEHLHRIFEPFFTTRGPRSSGLGLAMAWGVMERLGGAISASNRAEGGAAFTLTLPRAPGGESEWLQHEVPGSRGILVVDDDRDAREALAQILVLRGHRVDTAGDGREALSLYDPKRHDAVLCDVSMPNMNGLQLARAVRARHPQALIALVTGWGSEVADDERGTADAVFRKPIDLDALARFLVRTSPRAEASRVSAAHGRG